MGLGCERHGAGRSSAGTCVWAADSPLESKRKARREVRQLARVHLAHTVGQGPQGGSGNDLSRLGRQAAGPSGEDLSPDTCSFPTWPGSRPGVERVFMQQKSQPWLQILHCNFSEKMLETEAEWPSLPCPCLRVCSCCPCPVCGVAGLCLSIRWRVDRHKTPHNCRGFRAPTAPYAGPPVKKLIKHREEHAHPSWSRNPAAEH